MPPRHTTAMKNKYFGLRGEGMQKYVAARTLGIDPKTATAWEKNMSDSSGDSYRMREAYAKIRNPKTYGQLTDDGKRAFDDFDFFRRYHFGRLSSPWQVDAAQKFVEAIATPHKEFIVLNCPPGSGKSTLLHDIEAWLTVRNRAIRGMVGSATQRLASTYNNRLRRTLERIRPPDVDQALISAGRAVQPVASLTQTYGRFEPAEKDLWRMDEFIVAQYNDIAIGEKEPSWQAYGLDTEYLGTRVDIAVWDDVVTLQTMRTPDAIEKQRANWDDQAETRIEPGGALFLVGQRLGPMDLYAYNKAKTLGVFDDEDDEEWEDGGLHGEIPDLDLDPLMIDPEGSKVARLYHSIVYPAHDEQKCKGLHSQKKPRFWTPDDPDACLIDPLRLPWKELVTKQAQSTEKYRTVYQQEDSDPGSVLVPRWYITGGEVNGEFFPGCYDSDRGLHQIPKGLHMGTYSVCTVDMSPTKWWCVQWWLYDQESELRFLMDLIRYKMDADQFLDYNPDDNVYTGILEDLWQASNRAGRPFNILIIERNGAQRFLMQLSYFKRWCALRGVSYYPHDTYGNKSDPEYGVQTLKTQYRHGRVRLPNLSTSGDMGFVASRQLVNEVTVWPNGATDDCVMAQWFLEWWIPRIATPDFLDMPKKWVPNFVRSA